MSVYRRRENIKQANQGGRKQKISIITWRETTGYLELRKRENSTKLTSSIYFGGEAPDNIFGDTWQLLPPGEQNFKSMNIR